MLRESGLHRLQRTQLCPRFEQSTRVVLGAAETREIGVDQSQSRLAHLRAARIVLDEDAVALGGHQHFASIEVVVAERHARALAEIAAWHTLLHADEQFLSVFAGVDDAESPEETAAQALGVERCDRHLQLQPLAQECLQSCREQRVSAQVKEVIVAPNTFEAQ